MTCRQGNMMRVMKDIYPIHLAGQTVLTTRTMIVVDKFTGKPVSKACLASRKDVDAAIGAAAGAAAAMAAMPSHRRQAILQHTAGRLRERSEEFANVMVAEAGKTIRDARGEVSRALDTFRIAAEESARMYGEWLPLDISARTEGYQAITRRFPDRKS